MLLYFDVRKIVVSRLRKRLALFSHFLTLNEVSGALSLDFVFQSASVVQHVRLLKSRRELRFRTRLTVNIFLGQPISISKQPPRGHVLLPPDEVSEFHFNYYLLWLALLLVYSPSKLVSPITKENNVRLISCTLSLQLINIS